MSSHVSFTVSNNPVVNNPVNDQSSLDDIPFFTESQSVVFEPIFRVLETPKSHIATPIMFDKAPVGMYNQSDTSSRRCPLYFKNKHPFQEYIGFETPNLLIQQFTDWCYPNSKSRGKRSVANIALQNKIIPEFLLADIKIGDKD
ncbi:hypothetical protein P3L10_002063 [Capsicum annuum]